jgi:LPXTG-motif cell wall-anchored protein
MSNFRSLVLVIGAIGGIILAPCAAFAHAISASVEVRADVVYVEVGFDETTPAEHAEITVTNTAGLSFGAGYANENGVFTMPRPEPGDYVLEAKCIGHTVRVNFQVQGQPDQPAKFGGQRNTTTGLAIGVALLLGFSAFFWFRRKRT